MHMGLPFDFKGIVLSLKCFGSIFGAIFRLYTIKIGIFRKGRKINTNQEFAGPEGFEQ